jgi:hypothetical protein
MIAVGDEVFLEQGSYVEKVSKDGTIYIMKSVKPHSIIFTLH